MEWGEIAQQIYEKLRNNGKGYLIEDMVREYGGGGTPGEMFLIVCSWLAKMRNNENDAFQLVQEEARLLFEIGYGINYFTKESLSRL